MANFPTAIEKRDGMHEDFKINKILEAVGKAWRSRRKYLPEIISEVKPIIVRKLSDFVDENRRRIIHVDEINNIVVSSLRQVYEETGNTRFCTTADNFEDHWRERQEFYSSPFIVGSGSGKGPTDNFLMVASTSHESANKWDRKRILISLINEAEIEFSKAKDIAKAVETDLFHSYKNSESGFAITTDFIRTSAQSEMLRRGMSEAADKYRIFGTPASDLEELLFAKNAENSNIAANNPEAVNFSIAGAIGKKYALSKIFDREIADAHTRGEIHLHDLDMPWRVYCSAHSLEYDKKFGLSLENLQTSSSPSKHARTLTGHLNTKFASLQAYYAGALGVGYVNVFYAPHIQADLENDAKPRIDDLRKDIESIKQKIKRSKEAKKDVSLLEELVQEKQAKLEEFEKDPLKILGEEKINALIMQESQHLIYQLSQSAFSRGGQTLFIDFNIHPGVPHYFKDTLAVEPGGKYAMWRNGKKVLLEEQVLEETTASGYHLMKLIDPETKREVMVERVKKIDDTREELVQEWNLKEGERPVVYKDYDKISKMIAKSMLDVWRKGDKDGQPFAFPKCDFHVSKDTFEDPEQVELLKYACQIASENGSPYIIFDRDEVTLAACCRLRTSIDDNYVLKHPEAMRFCGFQNVTINLPQAAYRASRKGKKGLDGLIEEIDKSMDLAVKAHIQKRDFIKKLQKEGRPQWQTGKISPDGQAYIDLDKSTYIIGLIGLNEAVQHITGKELHELDKEEFEKTALRVIAHMNIKAKDYGKNYGLKFSLEESPAESATRRLSMIDLIRYPEEAKPLVKGDIEKNQVFYTNSIHLRPDAQVDLITRIALQSKFHPAIESGAIIHAFVGEEKPDSGSIYNLVKKTFENTQCAQLTVSPEFTVCKSCSTTHRGLLDSCTNCGNEDKKTLKQMTRIVGYYSFIDNWNESKLGELAERHKGNYSISGIEDIKEIPFLQNPDGNFYAIEIGKTGCRTCDGTFNALNSVKKILERKYNQDMHIEVYHADEERGMTKAMLGDVNLSAIPNVFVFSPKGELIYRGETVYEDGKADLITSKKILSSIKEYLERK